MNNKKQELLSKQIIKKALINTTLSGLVMSSVNVLAQTDIEQYASKSKPAYTLKIITHGEADNRSDNFTEVNRQDNRRADVTIKSSVPDGFKEETVTTTQKHQVKVSEAGNRSIRLADGGVIWVSKDAASMTPKLNVTTSINTEVENNKFVKPLSFKIETNYAKFIDEWGLKVYKSEDKNQSKPLVTFMGKDLSGGRIIKWNGTTKNKEKLVSGDKLEYVLTVKDKAGHIDETRSRVISLIGPERNLKLTDKVDPSTNLNSNLLRQTIPVNGSRVRIFGRDILEGNTIKINGDAISLVENKFVTEQILPDGQHEFDVEITDNEKHTYNKPLTVNLKGKYLFMVGLADITIGEGDVTGNLESLSDGDKYLDGDIFVDGRLAFYLKGKIKGKYLVTAQMDTETAPIDELFDDIHKKDPSSLFRRLDPDKYYPVYGDDSTLIDDTDSQGKIYVRVDWDKSRAIWGNYNTDMTGTELSSFNRSLYGAKLNHRSTKVTKDGEHKTDLTVFASEAQSAFRHNQFLGTGGSLYYLKDKDIVDGSEKVWIEVRARGESERALEKIVLEEGRDYQIDDFQGRIILNRPLLQIVKQETPSLIKDSPLEGDQLFLMVDYEYVPNDFVSDKASYGTRGKVWINDHVAVGGSYVHENRENNDYDLKGIDVTLQKAKGTYIKGEYAESEFNQTLGSFRSSDGGLNFNSFNNDINATSSEGSAYSLEARANIDEFTDKDGSIGAWYKKREAGFSSASFGGGEQITDTGIEAVVEINEKLKTSARATLLEKELSSKVTTASAQADYKLNQKATISAELRHVKEVDKIDATKDGGGTLAAFKVGYDLNKDINLYGIIQSVLSRKNAYEDNDLFTIGAIAKLNEKIDVNAEVSTGDRGDSALIGFKYAVNDGYDIYTNYTLSTDNTFDKRNLFTVGQRKTVSDQLKVYTEHQFIHEDTESGIGHTFGLDYSYTEELDLNASVQSARLDKVDTGLTDRDAFSVGLNYKKNSSKASMRLEYRKDRGNEEITDQWVTVNSVNHRLTPSLRLQGKFNYSETKDRLGNTRDAKFTEAGLGFAYRPIENDKLNVLGRITYLYDLQPIGQSDLSDEKSLIASIETSYQLNHKWEVGSKVAHKEGEIRADRDDGEWFKNDATLVAVRARYHLTSNWDAMAQYHWMNSDSSEDSQHGAMFSIDRHIGKNLKLGIGYNFTDFNDDLSDTDSSAKGWFINLVGKY
jgi:hypothetical protein